MSVKLEWDYAMRFVIIESRQDDNVAKCNTIPPNSTFNFSLWGMMVARGRSLYGMRPLISIRGRPA